MSTEYSVPSGLPDIVALAIQLWGNPTKRNPREVFFGARGSKKIEPAPKNRWFDHEANEGGGYLELYKLAYGKLPAPPGFPIPPSMAMELGDPVAWWDYQNARGRTIARVVRFHPPGQDKTYRQCRPDGSTWRWKMQGLKVPLYRLPELIQALDGSTVCITEGEKHADQIRAWDILATTNAGGAKKFRADHAAVLARFDCVIVPDNDEAGREHAATVAVALRAAECKSIRVLDLPSLPPKGDVIDWVRAGGTAEVFAEMVAPAAAYQLTTAASQPKANGVAQPQPAEEDPPPDIDDPAYHEALEADATSFLQPVDALVREFNTRYWVVNESGKAVIYEFSAFDEILNRKYYNKLAFADFEKLHLNRLVKVGDKFLLAAKVWLRHRNRRQYIRGVRFDPSGNFLGPEVLNLWQGFAVHPVPGSWDLMKSHIFEVICASNHELYDYLMSWMARLIQSPNKQGEVAVVLKGIEGTGKGILARAIHHIFGQHALAINHAKHLTGNFNAHLRDCVFLFADEAFYAGDKAHVGVLKSLITEPTLTIEAKYANAVQAPNFIHLMMASNEDWVVPASVAARRFLVLLTAPTKVGNRQYFTAVQKQMEAGGYEAMLHELQHRDLAEFNVRDVPDTEGLQEQKKLSLGTSENWWVDVLHRGYVYKSKLGLHDHFGQWHEVVSTEILYASYQEFAKAANERRQMAREAFGKFMVCMGAIPAKHRNGVVGEQIADVPYNQSGETKRQAALITRPFATGYRIGSLENARGAFCDATKLSVQWEADDLDPAHG